MQICTAEIEVVAGAARIPHMPTTTVTTAAFQTALAECADAVLAGNWAMAVTKLAVAETINAGLEVSVESNGNKVSRRESLEKVRGAIDAARAAQAAATDTGARIVRVGTAFS